MLMILVITSGMILILVVGLAIPATRPDAYIAGDSETSSHPDVSVSIHSTMSLYVVLSNLVVELSC